jgi:hypothetical protein
MVKDEWKVRALQCNQNTRDIKNILTNQTTAISMCFVLIPQDLESLSLIIRLKT